MVSAVRIKKKQTSSTSSIWCVPEEGMAVAKHGSHICAWPGGSEQRRDEPLSSVGGGAPLELLFFFYVFIFIYLTALGLSCGMQNLVLLPGWKPGSLHRRAVRCGVLATEPPGESRSFTLLTRPHTVVDWPHTVVDFPQGNLCSSEKKVRSKLLCEGSVQVSPGSGQWRNAVVREHCPRLGAIQPGAVLEMLRTVAPYILWFLILKGVIQLRCSLRVIMPWNRGNHHVPGLDAEGEEGCSVLTALGSEGCLPSASRKDRRPRSRMRARKMLL